MFFIRHFSFRYAIRPRWGRIPFANLSFYKHSNPTDSFVRSDWPPPWAFKDKTKHSIMNDEFWIMNFEVRQYDKSLLRGKRPSLSNLRYSIFFIRCSIFARVTVRLSRLPWAFKDKTKHSIMNDEFWIMNFEVRQYDKSLRRSNRPLLSNLLYSIFIIRCSIFAIQ